MIPQTSETTGKTGERPRIGVFYSYSPHFRQAVEAARKRFPDTEVTAFVPPDYPRSLLGPVADRVLEVVPEPGTRITARAFITVIQALRRERLDGLVVLFDSPRLQLLSWCSGARGRYWYTLDGRWEVLYIHPVTGMLRAFIGGVLGRCRYGYIWIQVHCRRVRPADLAPPASGAGKPARDDA